MPGTFGASPLIYIERIYVKIIKQHKEKKMYLNNVFYLLLSRDIIDGAVLESRDS